ncbi:hypothetical protein AX17_004792 [Amanita inopinata Kibby_2008]|nr:hypothetical protein AX17_004792 [Amanita inopinata Kibby_2008]
MNALFFLGDDDDHNLPPGTPPMQKFEGPWFTTQLAISAGIGFVSFFLFSYCRTRWPLSFAPRTKLQGFSPHEAHSRQAFFGWIMPTIRTSEFTVLQIVGLDAAVLLSFFKMAFSLFSVCSLFAVTILMPLNWKHNKDIEDEGTGDDDDWPSIGNFASLSSFSLPPQRKQFLNSTTPPRNNTDSPFPGKDWLDLISDPDSYLSAHLLFTYLFTILSLYFIHKNYRRFIRSRQLFSLELVHSIPARTILVTDLPQHLLGERPLAEYFENMGLAVESVNICRDVGSLKNLLDKRTASLLKLENAWVHYVGNPSTVEEYDPEDASIAALDAQNGPNPMQHQGRFVVPHRKRATMRPRWFKPKVDTLEYLEKQFKDANDLVKERRRSGRFKATQSAFVTFEKMSSAQIAVQVAHAPSPQQLNTCPAPEPRDIIWTNMSLSAINMRVRDFFVLSVMVLLFFFWIFPITALASLLSYKEIKKVMPWLGQMIDSNDKVRAIVQNSLPSMAMILLNAMLPFLLEALTYVQGYKARSWIEYSLLKKYFLFLLINVVFIFLLASTYWQLVRDLANSPAKVPEKLATALQAGRARHFFLSYVILQGLGIMPLQLLNLGVIIPRMFMRMFFTRTPRDFAELNAPPMINYGVVYPQAILMFVITLLYSVVQPLIVIFGAIYFGVGYVVYKYKLLFVFYKPYESQGQAWPITFIRCIWGIVIYLLFMIGIFTLRKSYVLSSLLVPLLLFTVTWTWYVGKSFRPLSEHVSLSSVFEVQRGEDTAEVVRLRKGHPVSWSQSNLNKRRYAQNDDTLYVAPEDERTDYSQPPMANWYSGVLNTGKKRYGHPALNGVLPEPWLPLKKGQTLVNNATRNGTRGVKAVGQAVVLTLRRRFSGPRRRGRLVDESRELAKADSVPTVVGLVPEGVHNPWDEASTSAEGVHLQRGAAQSTGTLHHRISFDPASGVMMLPDDGNWLVEDGEISERSSDEEDLPSENAGPEQSGTESLLHEEMDSGRAGSSSTPLVSTSPTIPSRVSRYGTYYHHRERHRPQIPGAFPGR